MAFEPHEWLESREFSAKALKAEVLVDTHINPSPNHQEIWLRDPDNYTLVISSCEGNV